MDQSAGAKIQAKVGETTHQRSAERLDLEIAVDLESDTNFYTGLTQNISTGGLFIATHEIKRVGQRVRLKFMLPGAARPIACDTEVRWIRENTSLQRAERSGMGVRFLNIDADAVAAIEAFIERRDSLYYDDE